MAKIKHDPIGGIDVSGATFVQQGSSIAKTFAPDVLEFLGKTGLDQFKRSKMRTAEQESKSLLEELTGHDRLLQIATDEAEVFAVEEELANEFSSFVDQDAEGAQLTRSQLLGLQEQKEMLSLQREAVIQGLLTEEEYRKKAEMSFYTQVALTPGIKDELAAVMAEHLGFDPRGQTAKITLDARQALKEQTDRARNKQIDLLNAATLWNNDQSDQANINQFWPIYQKQIQAVQAVQELVSQLSAQKSIDAAELRGVIDSARAWISSGLPFALSEMGRFKGINAHTLTIDEIRNMDDQTRLDWLDNIDATMQAFTDPVAQLSLRTGEKFEEAFTAMARRQEILRAIVSGAGSDEILAANLTRYQNEFNIELEMEKARLVRDQRGILTLAALADVLPIQGMLETQASQLTFLVNAMQGTVTNLRSLPEETQTSIKNMYRQAVSAAAKGWEADPKKWTEEQITTMGLSGNMIANHTVDQVDHEDRMHLFKLAGAPGFMTALEGANPEEALKMKQGVIKHQVALGVGWNTEMKDVLSQQVVPFTARDFYIKRVGDEDASWIVSMTGAAQDRSFETFLKRVTDPDKGLLRKSTRAKENSRQAAAEIEADLVLEFNKTPNLINNMVKSKAAALSIPMVNAVQLVARDLGISMIDILTVDIKPEPEKPGFAEETLGRRSSDLNPGTEAQPTSPEKLEDGTYVIGGQLVGIKNGEVVDLGGSNE